MHITVNALFNKATHIPLSARKRHCPSSSVRAYSPSRRVRIHALRQRSERPESAHKEIAARVRQDIATAAAAYMLAREPRLRIRTVHAARVSYTFFVERQANLRALRRPPNVVCKCWLVRCFRHASAVYRSCGLALARSRAATVLRPLTAVTDRPPRCRRFCRVRALPGGERKTDSMHEGAAEKEMELTKDERENSVKQRTEPSIAFCLFRAHREK